MTKYAIVPVEPTDRMMIRACNSIHPDDYEQFGGNYRTMLAARPPLDADMQAALELARSLVREGRSGDAGVLARALLRATGQEDGQ